MQATAHSSIAPDYQGPPMGASSRHSTCDPSDQQDTMFSKGNRDYVADAGFEHRARSSRFTGLYEVDLVTGLPVLSTIPEMHISAEL